MDLEYPIITGKLGTVQTIGFSRTPREAFRAVSPEKLALAVLLARRNVGESYSVFADLPSNSEDGSHHTRAGQVPPANEKVMVNSSMHASSCFKANTEVKKKFTTLEQLQERPPVGGEADGLKMDLENQLVRLIAANVREIVNERVQGKGVPVRRGRNVPSRGGRCVSSGGGRSVPGGGGRGVPGGEGGGVPGGEGGGAYFLDTGRLGNEENEERLERRRKEQRSRNTRMMYDLSHQVRSCSTDVQMVWQMVSYLNFFIGKDHTEEAG